MDYIKNTQKSEQLPRFLDGVRSVRTNPFGENKAGDRAYRRAERLVAAIHLLTNHIPSDEPLRTNIRRQSLALLSDVIELRDEMRAVDSHKVHLFQVSVRHLISMLRILAVAGFISIQNADAVTEALDELGNFLAVSQRSPMSESVHFSREDLLDVRMSDLSFKKDLKDSMNIKDKRSGDTNVLNNKTSNTVTTRGNVILDILRTGGEMGIRDVAAQVPEYSEKMIQRELLDLTQRGLVKKSGLKRWSKYSLAEV
ncbi:hypothetical protein HZC00_02290 [Candidatus Kaiserbacteria bacterium]|nr:hypothetical protein [Candidatus Kaiserbacteria bacterium]